MCVKWVLFNAFRLSICFFGVLFTQVKIQAQINESPNDSVRSDSFKWKRIEKQVINISDPIQQSFYDVYTKKSFRFFYNRTDRFDSGILKFPHLYDLNSEEAQIRLYQCGYFDDNGIRYSLKYNEKIICIYDNRIVTSLQDPFKGTTTFRSYSYFQNINLLDSLILPSPFISATKVKDGKYIILTEGQEINGNFVVVDNHLKHCQTYAPFIPNGFSNYDIGTYGSKTTISACSFVNERAHIKRAIFNEDFRLIEEDSTIIQDLDTSKISKNFSQFFFRGESILYQSLIFDNITSSQILSGYSKTGRFMWKNHLIANGPSWDPHSISFMRSPDGNNLLAVLIDKDDRTYYIGIFDESLGQINTPVNINNLYKKYLPNIKITKDFIKVIDAKWIDNERYFICIGNINSGSLYSDVLNLIVNTKGNIVEYADIIPEKIKAVSLNCSNNKINFTSDKLSILYEK